MTSSSDSTRNRLLIMSVAWLAIGAILYGIHVVTESVFALAFAIGTILPFFGAAVNSLYISKGVDFAVPAPAHLLVSFWLVQSTFVLWINSELGQMDLPLKSSLQQYYIDNIFLILNIWMTLFFVSFIFYGIKIYKRQRMIIAGKLPGRTGIVKKWKGNTGKILLDTSRIYTLPHPKRNWKATSNTRFSAGDRVKIVNVQEKLKFVEVEILSDEESAAQQMSVEVSSKIIRPWHWFVFGAIQIVVAVAGREVDIEMLRYLVVPGLSAMFCGFLPRVGTKSGKALSLATQTAVWILCTVFFAYLLEAQYG